MAEIDTNPLTPVWPQRPVRKINPEEKGSEQRSRQQRRNDVEKKNSQEDDDPSPHIDEYA